MEVKIHTKVLHDLTPVIEILTLSGEAVLGKNGEYEMSEQWHCLKVKYTGQKLKIDIYAPMGSKNDPIIEKFVKKHNLNFFKLSDRHFKH